MKAVIDHLARNKTRYGLVIGAIGSALVGSCSAELATCDPTLQLWSERLAWIGAALAGTGKFKSDQYHRDRTDSL